MHADPSTRDELGAAFSTERGEQKLCEFEERTDERGTFARKTCQDHEREKARGHVRAERHHLGVRKQDLLGVPPREIPFCQSFAMTAGDERVRGEPPVNQTPLATSGFQSRNSARPRSINDY
jgi:hypothetical protein